MSVDEAGACDTRCHGRFLYPQSGLAPARVCVGSGSLWVSVGGGLREARRSRLTGGIMHLEADWCRVQGEPPPTPDQPPPPLWQTVAGGLA